MPLLRALFWGGRWAIGPTVLAPRYLLVALGNGLLYLMLYHYYHFSVQGVVFALFATALLIVAGIDLVHKLIFDAITLPGIIVGLVASTWLTPVGLGNAVLGALLGGGLFLLLAVLSVVILHRAGRGGGHIKLIAMIGAFLGWQAVLVTIFLGAMGMAVVGLVLRLLRRLGPQELVPFGPFLALGALLAMVWGEPIFAWYVHRSL
jgi:leader peptidase (prepilin peptidase)/N-methyltransferase